MDISKEEHARNIANIIAGVMSSSSPSPHIKWPLDSLVDKAVNKYWEVLYEYRLETFGEGTDERK